MSCIFMTDIARLNDMNGFELLYCTGAIMDTCTVLRLLLSLCYYNSILNVNGRQCGPFDKLLALMNSALEGCMHC